MFDLYVNVLWSDELYCSRLIKNWIEINAGQYLNQLLIIVSTRESKRMCPLPHNKNVHKKNIILGFVLAALAIASHHWDCLQLSWGKFIFHPYIILVFHQNNIIYYEYCLEFIFYKCVCFYNLYIGFNLKKKTKKQLLIFWQEKHNACVLHHVFPCNLKQYNNTIVYKSTVRKIRHCQLWRVKRCFIRKSWCIFKNLDVCSKILIYIRKNLHVHSKILMCVQ